MKSNQVTVKTISAGQQGCTTSEITDAETKRRRYVTVHQAGCKCK